MQSLTEEASETVRKAVRRFLHGDSAGCDFVGYFAHKGEGIRWATFEGHPTANAADLLSNEVELAKNDAEAAGFVFPDIADENGLTDLLNALAQSQRWIIERSTEKRGGADVDVVRVCWVSASGERSSVLGMAPMFAMPPTRRAPYVSMFVWPGPRSNEFRKKPFPEIGIGDMAPPPHLDRTAYDRMRKTTENRSHRLNAGRLPAGATFILQARPTRPMPNE